MRPRAICIDDRIWSEARLTWTAAELIHRILSWFSRAARGDLHDPRQPLDPLIIGSPISFIIPRHVLRRAVALDLIGVHDPEHRQSLRVRRVEDAQAPMEQIEPICISRLPNCAGEDATASSSAGQSWEPRRYVAAPWS